MGAGKKKKMDQGEKKEEGKKEKKKKTLRGDTELPEWYYSTRPRTQDERYRTEWSIS